MGTRLDRTLAHAQFRRSFWSRPMSRRWEQIIRNYRDIGIEAVSTERFELTDNFEIGAVTPATITRIVMPRPRIRGEVSLTSADPLALARIRQNFLSTDQDRHTLRDRVRLFRDIAWQGPLPRFIARELALGPEVVGDAELDAFIRRSAITVNHTLGTCRMGPSAESGEAVDGELRVLGVEGLRIVDASVMPELVGGNINAAVMMIAEGAADLIRGRSTLESIMA